MHTSSPFPVRAEVRASGVHAPYMRAGSGRPILLLLAPESPASAAGAEPSRAWPAVAGRLTALLGGTCRLIVPAEPPLSDVLDEWVAAFADGLGIAGVTLVVSDSLAGAARAFALREPDLVSHLVVLREHPAGDASRDPSIERVEREGIPLLVLSIPAHGAGEEDEEALVGFLAGLPLE